jgi:predicted O-methyltransferase YrrM
MRVMHRALDYTRRRRRYVRPARAVARRTGDPRARHLRDAARTLARPPRDRVNARIEQQRRLLEADTTPYEMSPSLLPFRMTDVTSSARSGPPERYTVGDFTRQASITPEWGAFLRRLVSLHAPATALELGTASGISACYIAAGGPRCFISLEGDPAAVRVARGLFDSLGVDVDVRVGLFDQTLPGALLDLDTVDFVYIDGHHLEEQTLAEWDLIRPRLAPDAIVVWDDINWSDGMRRVWQRVRSDGEFSLELGRVGVVAR